MARTCLGTWTCPTTGNNVVAYYRTVGDQQAMIDMEWDEPPPLQPGDHVYYLTVIRPALMARVREYTERVGAAVVVDL